MGDYLTIEASITIIFLAVLIFILSIIKVAKEDYTCPICGGTLTRNEGWKLLECDKCTYTRRFR